VPGPLIRCVSVLTVIALALDGDRSRVVARDTEAVLSGGL
jgi:hypothetical protein